MLTKLTGGAHSAARQAKVLSTAANGLAQAAELSPYVPAEIIKRKREGRALSQSEIAWMVNEYHKLDGAIRDYQMSAFLMAACVKGMTDREAADLTQAMLKTGDVIDLPKRLEQRRGKRDPVVDKHSTGGVGDKVSLVVAPLAASLGMITPMVSSRGLGHTGGTIDKLESVPGVRADLTPELFIEQLATLGCGIVTTNRSVSPVENRIYGLRDTSGSVESPALIASSIMCKKLAISPDAVLLDVKTGRGAFMNHLKDSVSLARMMVAIGENAGVTTRALITNMEQPLGASVGNILEVREALYVLNPRKSAQDGAYIRATDEVRELATVHVASMLCMVNKAPSFAQAYSMAAAKLKDGSAYDMFLKMIEAQGGDLSFVSAPDTYITTNTHSLVTMTSPITGKIKAIDAYKIGMASLALGSGRLHADDPIDPFAGILLHAKVGDTVSKGDPLYTASVGFAPKLASASARLDRGTKRAKDAFVLTSQELPVQNDPLVSYVVDPNDIYSFDHGLSVAIFRGGASNKP